MVEDIAREYYAIIKNKISQARFESALGSIEKLLSNFPNDKNGYYYKGVCLFALEQYEESIKNYSLATQLDITFAKAYFNRGICYYTLNHRDQALINFGKALILFSKSNNQDARLRCLNALKLMESETKS